METKKIYVITTFEKVGVDNHGFPDYGDQRCVGWFDNYEDAIEAVECDEGLFHEGVYNYAVIEILGCGLYPVRYGREYFKYNRDKESYEPIEKEKVEIIYEMIPVWSIG